MVIAQIIFPLLAIFTKHTTQNTKRGTQHIYICRFDAHRT